MSRNIFTATEELSAKLFALIDLPLYDQSTRLKTSDVACSMSLEHWSASINLLKAALLPSAVTVHRAQFEALLRSIWVLYAASDSQIERLSSELTLEAEQAAKAVVSKAKTVTESEVATAVKAAEKPATKKAEPAKIAEDFDVDLDNISFDD